MRILVAYECSGAVRRAMTAKGHEVWSNDILPAEDGSPMHLQMDAWDAILNHGPWNMIFNFRPCTYLCGSGLHWNNRGRGWENTNADLADTQRFMDYCEEHGIAYVLENPVGLIGTRIRPSNQTIHPYYFGDDASKRTCLWLHKVAPLETPPKDKWCPPRIVCGVCRISGPYPGAIHLKCCPQCGGKITFRWGNQTDSGQNRLGPSESRTGDRSRTYPGIAAVFAEAWG